MNKKNVLWIGFVGTVLFMVSLFASQIGICKSINLSCTETFDPIAELIFIFIPFFIFSLITYKMREEVFKSWLKFSYWWILLSIFFILITPEYSNSLIPVERDSVSLFLSLLFLIISSILIVYKHFSSKK